MKSWNEMRRDATKFAHRWKGAYDEKSQAKAACGPVGFTSSRAFLRLGASAILELKTYNIIP